MKTKILVAVLLLTSLPMLAKEKKNKVVNNPQIEKLAGT